MANRFLGEATAVCDGKQYTLRLDMNAMCEFEEATGKDAMAAFAAFENSTSSVREMRTMTWAMLRYHHPDVSLIEAGSVLSADLDALRRAVTAAMPDAKEDPDAPAGQAGASGKRRGRMGA